MRSQRRIRRGGALVLSLSLVTGVVEAQTCAGSLCGSGPPLTFFDSVGPQPPALVEDLTVPAFDDTLGTLVGVELRAVAQLDVLHGVENVSPAICPDVTWSCDSLLQVDFVEGSFALVEQLPMSLTTDFGALPPFDGVIDFGGTSGTMTSLVASFGDDACIVTPERLQIFRASVAGPSLTFTAQVAPVTATLRSGCGNVASFQQVLASVALEVRYAFCLPTPGAPYCSGDGSGAACPCGNSGATGHGCANGSFPGGCVLTSSGIPSVTADSLVLRAFDATPGQPGLFFQGESAVDGGDGAPFGDGLRCAGGNVARLQVVAADGAGAASSSAPIGAIGGAEAGELLRYQLWYRDPSGSPCGSGFNLSNGLAIAWAP